MDKKQNKNEDSYLPSLHHYFGHQAKLQSEAEQTGKITESIKIKNETLKIEKWIKIITSSAMVLFIFNSYYIQLSLLFDIKFSKEINNSILENGSENLWKVFGIVTASFTVIFTAFIMGVFGSKNLHTLPLYLMRMEVKNA